MPLLSLIRLKYSHQRMFHDGYSIKILNLQGKPKWLSVVLLKEFGSVTFRLRLEEGRIWKRHVDHMISPLGTSGFVFPGLSFLLFDQRVSDSSDTPSALCVPGNSPGSF